MNARLFPPSGALPETACHWHTALTPGEDASGTYQALHF
jgi:hypothetical protein